MSGIRVQISSGGSTSVSTVGSTSVSQSPPCSVSPIQSPTHTMLSRTEEKRTLGHLNSRLAAYIEKVRNLELENGRLEQQVSSLEESRTREVTSVRGMFDKELSQARKAVDDIAMEKAKLEMEAERYKTSNRDLQTKLEEREAEVGRMERILASLKNQLSDAQRKADDAVFENKKILDELNNLKSEHFRLEKKLEDTVKNLENETLNKIDIQNQLQTLKEEHKFDNTLMEQKIKETTTRKQMEIEEVEGKAREEYDLKLQTSLQELRDAYEQKIMDTRTGFTAMYNKRIQDLQDKLAGERGSSAGAVHEVKEVRSKMENMVSKLRELETNNNALQSRLKELQDQLENQGRKSRADLAQKQQELDFLNEEHRSLSKEYQELLEMKVVLDMEITAYRTLLEGEETRLGLGQKDDSGYTSEAGNGSDRKRKWMFQEDEFVGSVRNTFFTQPGTLFIEPIEKEVKCVKLTNKGEESISMEGHSLCCISEGVKVTYYFGSTDEIEPGASLAVWSSDAGVEHKPMEGQIVMRDNWKIGETCRIEVCNSQGTVLASRETWRETAASGSSRSQVVFAEQTEREQNNCSDA